VFSDGLYFQRIVFLIFGRLYDMYVLCRVCIGRILSFVCYYDLDIFFISESHVRHACPMYLHFNRHARFDGVFSLGFKWFYTVLILLDAVFKRILSSRHFRH
jgi:hypothetical protein